MTLYIDANVVVATLLDEPATATIAEWIDVTGDDLALSDLAVGEVVAALHRGVRMERLERNELDARVAVFDRWRAASCEVIAHVSDDIRRAVYHVRQFDLAARMPDAIHLATCARLGMTLVTRDRRLLRAAETLGIDAVRPG